MISEKKGNALLYFAARVTIPGIKQLLHAGEDVNQAGG